MMRILFTGASSFTGLWFVEALATKGHAVVAPLQKSLPEYEAARKMRIQRLENSAKIIFDAPFGSEAFFQILEKEGPFDLLCHHAAQVTDYKSPAFDFAAALQSNTHSIIRLCEHLKAQKCQKILLTGSLFEQREGLSNPGHEAVSPYGLSKGLTSDVFQYFSALYKLKLGKFVIPNPFGPYEEKRFTTYLAECWLNNQKGVVSFPYYVRDNFPVSLLAQCYAQFAESLTPETGFSKINPSFRPESQGPFVQSFAKEMQVRLNVTCEIILQVQTEFPEPKIRINNDLIDPAVFGWSESTFWDQLAAFYLQTIKQKT